MLWCQGPYSAFISPITITFLALIAVGIILLTVEAARKETSTSDSSKRVLELLKERYAKGEITREQFIETREDLES